MKYYKRYNDKFYNYDEAYNLIEKHDLENVIMRTSNRWASPSQVEVTWKMIHEQKNSMCIPVWAVKSDKWTLWMPDYEKQNLADNAGDWIRDELDLRVDSRFWEEENMSIEDWWMQLQDHVLLEDDYVEIMNFLKQSGRLKNWKERNKKYYQEQSD